MTRAASDRAAAIFFALSNVPVDDRAALLIEKCGDDQALRAEVERLLANLALPEPPDDGRVGAASSDDELARPAGTAVGDFVVIRQIGAGGTGVVHFAQQKHPPRIVALKMLRQEFLASTVRRRFEIEAELLAHLHHPGIAEIYTAHPGDDTTPPFIAMELVNGPPLTEFADSHQLSIRDRVELVARVCDAVQHAHQRGIIHRDLKPGNILVGEDGQPKVLDFGVARRLEQATPATVATETGQLVGTLAYMSPEQVLAKPEGIDTRTDIYALGVILFRLLSGRLPFGHDNPPLPELARRIVQDDPPKLGAIDPALRGDLEVIVARAMAKEKERRYAATAGLAADLRRFLDGQPISASADSAWYVVRRQIRRYRLALGLSAAAVTALAGLAVYASLQRSRADGSNLELQRQLSTSTIERGRLLSLNGNHPAAEELVWRELFKQPDSLHAQWALWEIYSREPTLWSRIEHVDGTQTVRFSPDSRVLLTAGRLDGEVHLIDVDSGRLVRTFAAPPTGGLRRALFTPDGAAIVTGSDDGTIRVWDVATGVLKREIPKAVERLFDFAVAADSTTIVTVAWGRVQVWSIATGTRLEDLPGLGDIVSEGAASSVSPLVVFGTDDGTLTAMDLTRRTQLWHVRTLGGLVSSIAISPDTRVIASGSSDGNISLWNAATGERLRVMPSDNGRVRNLTFDETGTRLAAAGEWRTRIWDLSQANIARDEVGGSEGITDLHFRADGAALATCNGASGLVRLWYLAADPRQRHWSLSGGDITGFGVSATTDGLYIARRRGEVSSWDGKDSTLRRIIPPDRDINGLAVSHDGRWLVTMGPGGAVVRDASTGQRLGGLPDLKSSRAVTFSDDDRRIVAGQPDGTLVIWDWADSSAREPRRIPSGDGEILGVASRDRRVFIAYRIRAVVVRDLETGRELKRLSPSASPFSVAVTRDGRRLAAGTYSGAADVWDLSTGEVIAALKGQTALVNELDFSPDGSVLALGSRDGSTRLWDVRSRQALATISSRTTGVTRLRFLGDGRRLAIGYGDGELEIIDLQYFFRFVAGQTDYQLRLLRNAGASLPRADEVVAWSRQILSGR